jgi:hypothetical protein
LQEHLEHDRAVCIRAWCVVFEPLRISQYHLFLEAHVSAYCYFYAIPRLFFVRGMKQNLPWLFFAFSLMYAICLYIWQANIRLIKDGKPGYFDSGNAEATPPPIISGGAATPSGPTVYPIHYLMGFLLVLKFFSLFFESIRYLYLRVVGHAAFFSAVYYTFAFLKGVTLFTGKSIGNRKAQEFSFERSTIYLFSTWSSSLPSLLSHAYSFNYSAFDRSGIIVLRSIFICFLHSNSRFVDWLGMVFRQTICH